MRLEIFAPLAAVSTLMLAGASAAQDGLTMEEHYRAMLDAVREAGFGEMELATGTVPEDLELLLPNIVPYILIDPSDEPETPAPMPEDLWAEYQEAEARFEADDDVTTEDLENLIVSYLGTYGPTGTDLAEVIDPLVVLPGSRPGDPRIADYQVVLPPWADYPYFTTGQRTAVMPDENADFLNPSAHATYNGAVRGVLADGEALSGTSFFDIGFNPGGAELDGHFNFVTGETVTFSGTQDGDLLYFNIDSGGFRDGTIAHGNGSGGFYGPAAQEFAGDWAFTVVDGTDPGLASGQFAAKR